jgi:sterol desaturase/sphingolipid hydroxylase (fatty acid hydroxylase superfamily)
MLPCYLGKMGDLVLRHFHYVMSPQTWGPLIIGFFVFFLIEYLYPARQPNIGAFARTLVIACSAVFISQFIAIFPGLYVDYFLSSLTHPVPLNMMVFNYWFDGSPSPIGYVPSITGSVIFTLLGMVVFDFFYYWYHRLQHTKVLWFIHKVHHSERHMTAAAAYRHHILEWPMQTIFLLLPMGFVLNLTQLTVFAVALKMHTLFYHSNLRIDLGPLTPVIIGPQYHRVHHSINEEHQDKNFGGYFPLWDIVFGTYHRPEGFPDTGISLRVPIHPNNSRGNISARE